MRSKLNPDFPYRLSIRNPNSKRASFGIEQRKFDQTTWKTIESKTVKHPTLDAINERFRAKALDFEAARKAVDELVEQIYIEMKAVRAVVHNNENYALLDHYWEKEMAGRRLEDPKTAYYELRRAVDAVGTVSIQAGSKEELQAAMDKFKGDKQRRLVSALNRLLVHAKRADVKLRQGKPEKRRVPSLSQVEFAKMLEHVRLDTLATLCEVAFFTGARIGECFALESEDFNEEKLELRIEAQQDKKGARRDTKNDRDRVTLVFPQGVRALKKWFTMKHKIDMQTRLHMAEIVKDACRAAFPSEKHKHLKFHDLRHCYARLCREGGMSTEDVADLIGDSIVVAKKHYTGFGATDAIMDIRRRALLGPAKKRAA